MNIHRLFSLVLLVSACQYQPPSPTASPSQALSPTIKDPPIMNAPVVEHIHTINGGDKAFDAPYGVDVSPDGRVYIFDTGNQQVRVFDSQGEPQFAWGAPGEGPGQFASLGFGALALDPEGHIFVVDNGNFRIQKFDADGNFILAFGVEGEGSGRFQRAIGIAIDDSGNVYVTDDAFPYVQIFDNQGIFLRQFGGEGQVPGQFQHATGITLDPMSRIYVADYSLKYVQVFDLEGNHLQSWEIGPRNPVPGTPEGMSVDSYGRIYVSDYDRGGVEVCTPEGEYLGEFGEPQLHAPVDIAIGSDGRSTSQISAPTLFRFTRSNRSIAATGKPERRICAMRRSFCHHFIFV